jgi:hypothetical protein
MCATYFVTHACDWAAEKRGERRWRKWEGAGKGAGKDRGESKVGGKYQKRSVGAEGTHCSLKEDGQCVKQLNQVLYM